MIGVDRRDQFRERIGARLLDSELVHSGQGYCLALARLGTTRDADILTAYLDHYLRRPDLRYDQDWALGALIHLDAELGTDRAAQFLRPQGLWEQWIGSTPIDAAAQRERIDTLCSLVQEAATPRD